MAANGTSAPAAQTHHAIEVSLERILAALGEAQQSSPKIARALRLLRLLMRVEVDKQSLSIRRRLDEIIHAAQRGVTSAQVDQSSEKLTTEIRSVLTRANYLELVDNDLRKAMASQSLVRLRLHLDQKLWRRSVIFVRGKHAGSAVLRSCFGLRKRTVHFDMFDRLFVYVEHQPKSPVKQRDGQPLTPPDFYVRLFENVPIADMEMLLPTCTIGMRHVDKCLMFGPAIFAVIGIAAVIKSSWNALYNLARWQLGIDLIEPVIPGGALAAVGGGFIALALWGYTQFGRYQKLRLQYMKVFSQMILYRMLDRDMGAAHHILDEAGEEESKEVILAYQFLLNEASTALALDQRIEKWIRTQFKIEVDFEVEDALAKLERLGIASCLDGVWTAREVDETLSHLSQQWNQLAG